ncbi:homoserine kinase [Herbidospora sp. NEAU-GS84]|uniref:Homoserine kinase n=1 Tax=Herbidospora solisilvae TaxID=2696284 RepID=A0A7C9J9Y9_9ACTN|nr:homoserine kinase [Herbidospora solisilvae]NAS24188.1 homoserine kinase [Herbidospora solisilvae]
MTVLVRTPATSANLGPGFDTLGLALDLHDEVTASIGGHPTAVEVEGEGAGEVDTGEGHLIVRTMRRTFDEIGVAQPEGIRLTCVNRIPHARGLGSSSAAIVAGILAARALAERLSGAVFDDDKTLALATAIEGHPDNVAPCLRGGLTISWDSGVRRLVPHPGIRPVVLIPPFRLSTEEARGLLPDQVPHSDAAANAGRAALLVAALTAEPDGSVLLAATEDRLHQRYRAPAMPRTADLVERLRSKGVPAVVSGAGPTVLAFSTPDTQDLIEPEVGIDWQIQPLNVDPSGATVQFPETR